jgi:hypothetical protein
MEEETLRNAEVAREVRERLIALKVDVGARPDFFRETVGGGGGLASVLLDESGDVVSVLPGFAAREAFLAFLQKGLKGRDRLREAREARSAIPDDVGVLHTLAETYHDLGSSRRAEECFGKILARSEEKAPAPGEIRFVAFAHERLARARILRGKNQDARADKAPR